MQQLIKGGIVAKEAVIVPRDARLKAVIVESPLLSSFEFPACVQVTPNVVLWIA